MTLSVLLDFRLSAVKRNKTRGTSRLSEEDSRTFGEKYNDNTTRCGLSPVNGEHHIGSDAMGIEYTIWAIVQNLFLGRRYVVPATFRGTCHFICTLVLYTQVRESRNEHQRSDNFILVENFEDNSRIATLINYMVLDSVIVIHEN
uniref:Uncharacterized protein n=1 Tax=Rhizophagus irregularis (strain DAOM 181602 / DAOM 197198 / MUCL 43194) TaxID=747089 RepID=U9TB12_RHIID